MLDTELAQFQPQRVDISGGKHGLNVFVHNALLKANMIVQGSSKNRQQGEIIGVQLRKVIAQPGVIVPNLASQRAKCAVTRQAERDQDFFLFPEVGHNLRSPKSLKGIKHLGKRRGAAVAAGDPAEGARLLDHLLVVTGQVFQG